MARRKGDDTGCGSEATNRGRCSNRDPRGLATINTVERVEDLVLKLG